MLSDNFNEAIEKVFYGAEEGSWTPTPVKGLEPESSVYTNFTTSAQKKAVILSKIISVSTTK